MAKVRRTKIIIEEVIGEDEGSTKVFVNGDQFKEIDFTDEKKDSKKEKKKTTSSKKKTSSNKSSSTSSKKKATSSKKKTTSSSKKKSTNSKNSSKKKTTSTRKKKEENKNEVQETQSTASVIELPLKEDKKEVIVEEQVSSNTTKDSGFAEISLKNEDKIIENAVPTPIEENGVSLVDKEENNKEVIDNPEVIDGEIKATNEVEIKGEKPETLEAEIVEKEEEKGEEKLPSEEKEKNSTKNESDASLEEKKSEETPKEENIEESKISESSEDKNEDNKDIKEDEVDQIEETKGESNKDTSKETETKEDNVSTTYTVVESNENDNKEESNKEEESKISKLFSTKGLIVGGVILVALLAVLIPISLNLSNQSSNSHLIEISEEDINKNNFISSSSAFFDNLESLELDIYDIRSTTTSLQTSLDYSFVNEIYSFELTNELHYVNEETAESVTDKLTYNQNEDNYTFTTTVNGESLNVKDETETYTKNQAKEMLQKIINNFYSNYLNCDGSSIKALIDDVTTKEESTLTYYYHDEANTYQIRDTSNSLLIVFDQYGIIESADYSHPGWCLPEAPSEPGINYYTLDLSYTLKTN